MVAVIMHRHDLQRKGDGCTRLVLQDVVRKIKGGSNSSGQAQPAMPSQVDAEQLRKLLA